MQIHLIDIALFQLLKTVARLCIVKILQKPLFPFQDMHNNHTRFTELA